MGNEEAQKLHCLGVLVKLIGGGGAGTKNSSALEKAAEASVRRSLMLRERAPEVI